MFSIAQAIKEIKAEGENPFSFEDINLAWLSRRTGVSRGKLRRLKQNGFQMGLATRKGVKHKVTKLSGYTGISSVVYICHWCYNQNAKGIWFFKVFE